MKFKKKKKNKVIFKILIEDYVPFNI